MNVPQQIKNYIASQSDTIAFDVDQTDHKLSTETDSSSKKFITVLDCGENAIREILDWQSQS